MSDLLTDAAPSTEEPTAPVGESGDAPSGEVVGGSSADPEGFVPKERFDGLMSSFNKAQADAKAKAEEVSALEARIAQMEAQLTKPNQENEVTDSADTIARLESQIAQLTELVSGVATRGIEAEMEAVWSEFPDAAPFKDLFVADNPNDLREVVSTFSERLKGVAPAPAGDTTEPPAAQESTPPAGGGGVAVPSQDLTPTVELQEAIAKRDVAGYLAAKAKQVHGDEGGLKLSSTS